MNQTIHKGSQDIYFERKFFKSNKTFVHPTAILGKNVKLSDNVKIGPYSIITGNVEIGKNTKIYSHSVIGTTAQNLDSSEPTGKIIIGNNVQIREFVSIGSPKNKNSSTIIGNNCYIMNYCHIAHDVTIENNVTMVNNVNVAGHAHIEMNAVLMGNSAVHQNCRVGKFTALSPFSAIRQDIPPFSTFVGLPAKFFGLNTIALKRANFSNQEINNIKHITKLFYQDKQPIEKIEQIIANSNKGIDPNVKSFIKFIKKSSRGVSRKSANDK